MKTNWSFYMCLTFAFFKGISGQGKYSYKKKTLLFSFLVAVKCFYRLRESNTTMYTHTHTHTKKNRERETSISENNAYQTSSNRSKTQYKIYLPVTDKVRHYIDDSCTVEFCSALILSIFNLQKPVKIV